MKSEDEVRNMMEKLGDHQLLPHESTAHDYLIEPLYEDLQFAETHEGRRLYKLCVEVIESALIRLNIK